MELLPQLCSKTPILKQRNHNKKITNSRGIFWCGICLIKYMPELSDVPLYYKQFTIRLVLTRQHCIVHFINYS